MYHTVKVTPDNHLKIIKWLTTESSREMFRDAVGLFSPENTYFVTVYITSQGQVSAPMFYAGEVMELAASEVCMIRLD